MPTFLNLKETDDDRNSKTLDGLTGNKALVTWAPKKKEKEII